MDSKISKDLLSCDICFELFSEDTRCPRVLPCGHTLCHSCLENILLMSAFCPTCQSKIKFLSAQSIPINFFLKSLISSEKNKEPKDFQCLPQHKDASTSRNLLSVGYCLDHDYNKELRCMDCEAWICIMCSTLKHNKCTTMLVKDAYIELGKQLSQKIEREQETRNAMKKEMSEFLKFLKEESDQLIGEISAKEKELKECLMYIDELKVLQTEDVDYCEALEHFKISVPNTPIDDEFSKVINEVYNLLEQGKKQVKQVAQLQVNNPYSIEGLQKLGEKGPLYAYSVENEGQELYGKVFVKDGRVHISSFQTENPESRLIKFQNILSRLSKCEFPKTAFLQITTRNGNSDPVEIIIETDGSLRAKNFVLLCSAIKRLSFKGAMLNVSHVSCFLPRPGPPSVVGVFEAASKTTWTEGLVVGSCEKTSSFAIGFQNLGERHYKIGVVVSGLDALKRLNRNGQYSQFGLQIKDCGLVI